MNLQDLDNRYCDGSEWENVLLSTETAIVKVVHFGDGDYSVLTYKLGTRWRVAYNKQHRDPATDDMIEAIAQALAVATK